MHAYEQITNTDTARVLTMIEASCPNALSRKVSTDEVLINFDALTPRCFHEVNTFVLNCFLNISGSKKNKKRKLADNAAEGAPNESNEVDNAASASNKAGESEVQGVEAEEAEF